MVDAQIISDRTIYIVTTGHSGGAYLPERNVADLDRATTVNDIADRQYDDVLQVLECDLVERLCSDATISIAWEVSEIWADRGEPLSDWQEDFLERTIGLDAALAFPRVA